MSAFIRRSWTVDSMTWARRFSPTPGQDTLVGPSLQDRRREMEMSEGQGCIESYLLPLYPWLFGEIPRWDSLASTVE